MPVTLKKSLIPAVDVTRAAQILGWPKHSARKGSVRSDMSIVRGLRHAQAPLGAACSGPGWQNYMALLAELWKKIVRRGAYRHGAPSGAFRPSTCRVTGMRHRLPLSPIEVAGFPPRVRTPRGRSHVALRVSISEARSESLPHSCSGNYQVLNRNSR